MSASTSSHAGRAGERDKRDTNRERVAGVPPGLIDDYGWGDSSRDPSLEALSMTVGEPADAMYLPLLAPRERLPRELTVAEALDASLSVEDFAWGSVLVQTDTLEGWTVFLEPNGWAPSDTDVLARLSKQGRAV